MRTLLAQSTQMPPCVSVSCTTQQHTPSQGRMSTTTKLELDLEVGHGRYIIKILHPGGVSVFLLPYC